MAESAVNPLPPPWGAARDPHFEATKTFEGANSHTQITAEDAALRGWLFRSAWYRRLVPDTRRCRHHGEIIYPEAQLTQEQLDIVYKDQNNGMASGPIG